MQVNMVNQTLLMALTIQFIWWAWESTMMTRTQTAKWCMKMERMMLNLVSWYLVLTENILYFIFVLLNIIKSQINYNLLNWMKNIINSVEKHYIISIDEKISKISLFQAIRSLTKNSYMWSCIAVSLFIMTPYFF